MCAGVWWFRKDGLSQRPTGEKVYNWQLVQGSILFYVFTLYPNWVFYSVPWSCLTLSLFLCNSAAGCCFHELHPLNPLSWVFKSWASLKLHREHSKETNFLPDITVVSCFLQVPYEPISSTLRRKQEEVAATVIQRAYKKHLLQHRDAGEMGAEPAGEASGASGV